MLTGGTGGGMKTIPLVCTVYTMLNFSMASWFIISIKILLDIPG